MKDQLRGDTIAALRAKLDNAEDPMLGGWLGEETAAASAAILDRGSG